MASASSPNFRQVRQQANILAQIRAFLHQKDFVEVLIPEMVSSIGACEELDRIYDVESFGSLAFLRQTGQIYLEGYVVQGLKKAYCEGQSFRKEPESGDGRHLCEFRLIEVEAAGMDLDELINFEVATLRHVISHLDASLFDHATLERLDADLKRGAERVTYRDAIGILDRHGKHLEFGDDIDAEAERILMRHFKTGWLALTHNPTESKFFNMRPNRDDPEVVDSCDLILRDGGETFGSAVRDTDAESMRERLHTKEMFGKLCQRSEDFAVRRARLDGHTSKVELATAKEEAQKLVNQSFDDYFTLISEHPIPRAGYGLGTARLFQYILGTARIEEASTLPITRQSFDRPLLASVSGR